MVKIFSPHEPGYLDSPANARLWSAIRDNNGDEALAAIAQGANARGCARRGLPCAVFALEQGAGRALQVLLDRGASVWDEYEGKPVWGHTFSIQVPSRMHKVVFAASDICASARTLRSLL